MEDVAKLLDIYTLSEILEMSDVTEEDILELLYYEGRLKCPPVKPL